MKLTPKQEAFCNKYIECGNASEAYRFAYDVGENTKNEAVHVNASKLMDNANVSLRISNLQKELAIKHEITRERLVEEYLDLIRVHKDCREYFDGDSIKGSDLKKIYALSNSGFIKGSDVTAAINGIAKLMGFDKEKKQEAQVINNIQVNIKRDRE